MRRARQIGLLVALLVVAALASSGCDELPVDPLGNSASSSDASDQSTAPPPPPPARKAVKEEDADGQAAEQPRPDRPSQSPQAGRTRPTPGTTGKTARSQGPPIRLSGGTALPQTGPTGIMMGFSVDYQFVEGSPSADTQYVWVIERSRGEAARHAGPFQNEGNLMVMIPGWRPEEGPFKSHIEDTRGKRISNTIDLRR